MIKGDACIHNHYSYRDALRALRIIAEIAKSQTLPLALCDAHCVQIWLLPRASRIPTSLIKKLRHPSNLIQVGRLPAAANIQTSGWSQTGLPDKR
jgi:hypothetical protein